MNYLQTAIKVINPHIQKISNFEKSDSSDNLNKIAYGALAILTFNAWQKSPWTVAATFIATGALGTIHPENSNPTPLQTLHKGICEVWETCPRSKEVAFLGILILSRYAKTAEYIVVSAIAGFALAKAAADYYHSTKDKS